jgi:hypothetical protein
MNSINNNEYTGKPGWIAEDFNPQNEITFKVRVMKSLQITYLLSYENVHPVFMHVPVSLIPNF